MGLNFALSIIFTMFRSARALILLAVLLWQSLAMLAPVTVAQRAGALDHMTVHVQAASHHHHADHALHMDNADDAVPHLHADAGNSTTGMLTSEAPLVAHIRAMLPRDISQVIWHSPTLEGPLRPPMPSV